MVASLDVDASFDSRFVGISTADLVQELLRRERACAEQLRSARALVRGDAGATARRFSLPRAAKQKPLSALIFDVLRSEPILTSSEITKRLLARGWTTSSPEKGKMVSACVSMLVKKKRLGRRADRVFLVPMDE